MKAKITLVVIFAFFSCQAGFVSATATNTNFSKSMSLEPSISHRDTIDISQLYFSIEPEINTNIEFNFEDTEGQYLEFCIYHGERESDLIECIGYETRPTTISHTEKALKDTYFVKITCTECDLDGIDDVPFMITAKYTPESSNSQFIVFSLAILGFFVVLAVIYIFVKKREKNNISNSKQAASNEYQTTIQSPNNGNTRVVQNITYNIQDSVIAGNLDSTVHTSDGADGPPQA